MKRRSGISKEAGSSTVELVGLLPWLIVVAFAGWEILLATAAATSAENAARSGSRVETRDGDGAEAARSSLAPWLRDGSKVEIDGTKTTVTVRVPLIVPVLQLDAFTITRSAELPPEER